MFMLTLAEPVRVLVGMRIAPKVDLTNEQRVELQRLANGRRTEVRVATRARVVLTRSDGPAAA